MNRHDLIKALATRLNAEKHYNELNCALTHSSFNANSDTNNSRYIFLGEFAFRGYVATLLHRFVPGTGTQLQHILGNIFKNEHLNTLYEKFNLQNCIRHGEKFNHIQHRHIFVYGLLGFIQYFVPEEKKEQFVSHYFILPNKHLFEPSVKSSDFLAQCNILSHIVFQQAINVDIRRTTENVWQTTISVGDYVLAKETSVSHRYSRQKTAKKALKTLADDLQFFESLKPGYNEKISRMDQLRSERILQQKALYLHEVEQKQKRKQIENQLKKEKRQREKAEQDLARRKTKAEAAKRKESKKGKNTIYRNYSDEEIASMNAAKRRRLEDLGILTKQKN